MVTRHDDCCRGRREESREATSSKWRAKREGEETREKVREMIEKRDADNGLSIAYAARGAMLKKREDDDRRRGR